MTEDMNVPNSSEEPGKGEMPEAPIQANDELPAVAATPATTEEATQSMATDVPAAAFPTAPVTPPAVDEATQITPVEIAASTVQATPLMAPAYEPSSAPTEAVPSLAAPMVGQPVASDPAAFYAQYPAQPGLPFPAPGTYAQYPSQPGQLLPGQAGAPAPAAKKRRVALWVALIILVLLVVVGGGTAFAFTSLHAKTQTSQAKVQVPTPNETLQMYCQDVMAGNAQGIYDLLSQQAKMHTSLDDLQQRFNALNMLSSLGMKYSGCTFSNLRVSGSLAVATVSLTTSITFKGQTTSIATPDLVSLVLENNQWKIDFSSLAQPQPNVTLPTFPTPTPSSN